METEAHIKRELADPKLSVMAIGPGGENLALFACIMAGRGIMLPGARAWVPSWDPKT